MANDLKIKTIQFKRGIKEILEAKLIETDLGVPAVAEPIFETDTGKLKIGDGVTAYKDLPYFGDSTDFTSLPNFIIQDPLSNQVLLYDEATQSWVNKDLADKESIIYLNERGLTIQGYDEATHHQMLVKDIRPDGTNSLKWITPLSSDTLNSAVTTAESHMTKAGEYSQQAGNAAIRAEAAEGNAKTLLTQTMSFVNNKFWWGTAEEYNAEIAENGLNPGTFYFIKTN